MWTFRLLYLLLVLSVLHSITSADEDSVLAVEVRQASIILPSLEVRISTVCLGSCVVVDSGRNRQGRTGYLVLTAAHVVAKEVSDTNGLYVPLHYPKGTMFEVCVQKAWYPAQLVAISKHGDVACLIFLCNKHIPLTCLASKRALHRDNLTMNGFTNGVDQHAIEGKCRGEADYPIKSVAPNCDVFFGVRESVVEGFSGGAVFDKQGNLAGIVSSRAIDKPGIGAYTHVGEIRRFLSVGWDGNYDKAPTVEVVPMPDRAVPRELGDEPEPEPTLAE